MKSFTYFIVCLGLVAMMPGMSPGETKSGEITLISKDSANDIPVTVQIGTKLRADCKFSSSEFFGMKVIVARAVLENVSKEDMYYSYNVAFFDADHNLIGCTGQSSGGHAESPGDKTQLASAIIFAPASEIAKVKYFQVTWFESANKSDL